MKVLIKVWILMLKILFWNVVFFVFESEIIVYMIINNENK